MEALQGKKIVLIVTGSIAAYKSADLVRYFVKAGAQVRVVLTQAACEFITPLTLQTLSKNPVTTNLLNAAEEAEIGHIRIADEADVVVVAPASADFIAKAASGIAENAALAVILATKAPVVFAPAMNVNMWEHPLTKRNVELLSSLGNRFVTPGVGELACGWFGSGRLADMEILAEEIAAAVSKADFRGKHVVVTAGPTREAFDPVRFVSNRSSGKMGYALARAAKRRGAKVTLLSGPTSLAAPTGVEFLGVETASDMKEKLFGVLEKSATGEIGQISERILLMAAAVTDFRPELQSSSKIKSDKTKSQAVAMLPNTDILESVGMRRRELESDSRLALRIVGFAAETGSDQEILENAREKLGNKGADFIVANRVEEAFEKDTNRVWIVSAESEREIGPGLKDNVAEWILDAVVEELEKQVRQVRLTDIPFLLSPTWSRQGFFSGKSFLDMLTSVVGVENIEDLPIPFAAVCVDVRKGRKVTLDKGSLAFAVRASASLPAVFTPVVRGSELLVDGGTLDPLPVEAARALGADHVVAVELFGNTDDPKEFLQQKGIVRKLAPIETALHYISSIPDKLFGDSKKNNGEPQLNLIEIIEHTLRVSQAAITAKRLELFPCDVLVQPAVSRIGLLDFHLAEIAIALGRDVGERAVPELKKLLEQG